MRTRGSVGGGRTEAEDVAERGCRRERVHEKQSKGEAMCVRVCGRGGCTDGKTVCLWFCLVTEGV